MIRALSITLPTRRLAALPANQCPPAPYDHPAVRDLTIDADGLVRLAEFRYQGAALEVLLGADARRP